MNASLMMPHCRKCGCLIDLLKFSKITMSHGRDYSNDNVVVCEECKERFKRWLDEKIEVSG
jgi:predicted nucleic acid-binding Zn ribbon protein